MVIARLRATKSTGTEYMSLCLKATGEFGHLMDPNGAKHL